MPVEGRSINIPIVPDKGLDAISATTLRLMEVSQDPGVSKITMPFIYNPQDIFEAMQLYDLINGIPQETTLIVSGICTPQKTLALQSATHRLATPNTFLSLHSLIAGKNARLTAEDAQEYAASMQKMQERGKSLIIARAAIPNDVAANYFRSRSVVYTVEEAREIGEKGIIDGVAFNPIPK